MLLNIDTLGRTEIYDEIEAAAPFSRWGVSRLRWRSREKSWIQDDAGVSFRI